MELNFPAAGKDAVLRIQGSPYSTFFSCNGKALLLYVEEAQHQKLLLKPTTRCNQDCEGVANVSMVAPGATRVNSTLVGHLLFSRFGIGEFMRLRDWDIRLGLLRDIMLPSLLAQRQQSFLWVLSVGVNVSAPRLKELLSLLRPLQGRVQVVISKEPYWEDEEDFTCHAAEADRIDSATPFAAFGHAHHLPLGHGRCRAVGSFDRRFSAFPSCCFFAKVLQVAAQGSFAPCAYVVSWFGSVWKLDFTGNKEELAAQKEKGTYFRWPMGCGMSVIMRLDKGGIPATAEEVHVYSFSHVYAQYRIRKRSVRELGGLSSGKAQSWLKSGGYEAVGLHWREH